MPTPNRSIVRRIRTLSQVLGTTLPDADLLQLFVERRDEEAFATLLKRHGPMIMRLCRRLLPTEQDAEDAFQATFLVLARKAAAVKKAASIGPWLYGVAYRIAMKSRSVKARERVAPMFDTTPEANALDRLSVREAEAMLLEELARLPIRFRDALVLCHLEGKTRDEAARALRCPLGTLKDRLLRGKDLLHERLSKRGVALSTALVGGFFSETICPAAVNDLLARSTLQAIAEPIKQVSAPIAMLASAGARTIGAGRMKLAAGLMAATVVIGLAAGLSNFVTAAPVPKSEVKEPAANSPPPTEPRDPKGKRLDALGDPLPDGAVMRLGTRRHRVQTWPLTWQSLPDGKSYLALQNGELRRFDAISGLLVEKWPVPGGREVVGLSSDGRYLLLTNHFIYYSGFRPQGLKEPEQECILALYDLAERKEVWCNSKSLEPSNWLHANNCRFSKDNKFIVTTGQHGNGEVRLWNGETGKQLWELKTQAQSLIPIGFPDGGKLVALRGQNDGFIYLYNRDTGKEVRSFRTMPSKEFPGGALLSPDGSEIITGGWNPKPRVWDLMGKERAALEGHKEWAREGAFSPDGRKFYTGGNDSFVLERAWPSGKVVRTIELGRKGISELAISGDGKRLEVIFWGEQAIAFYDLATGKPLPDFLECHRSTIYGVHCAPNGNLVTFGSDGTVRTWDVNAGKAIAQFKVELDLNAGGFALSADGKYVAVPKEDIKGIHIYEWATGKLVRTIPADHWSMKQLMFSPDGRFLAAIGADQGLSQVWATDTGKQVLRYKAKEVGYGSTAGTFSPDGRIFAFSDHGLVCFWNTQTWKEETGLKAFANMGLAFSPDGRMLATASIEGVRIFEVATKRERAHLPPAGGYPSGIMRFSPNGRFLAGVNNRSTVQMLDVYTGAAIGPFSGHDDSITGLTFTVDGKALATSSSDSTVLLWNLAKPAAKNLNGINFTTEWQTLASEDAKAAFASMRTLATNPEKSVKRLGEKLKPAEPLDAEWVAARLRNFDSPKFAERDRATRDLEDAGERVVPYLEKLLANKPSVEARDRAERLLAKIHGPTKESDRLVRMRRALEVLEWIKSASARKVIETLSNGAAGATITEDAKATLQRWQRE